MGSGDARDPVLGAQPWWEPETHRGGQMLNRGQTKVPWGPGSRAASAHPSTLSLDQKRSADGDHHGKGEDGQECE